MDRSESEARNSVTFISTSFNTRYKGAVTKPMKTNFSKGKFILFSLLSVLTAAIFISPVFAGAVGVTYMTIPTTFTCADLLVSQAKAEEIWMDNAENAEYLPNNETVKAIYENQTAKLGAITGLQNKDNTIKIIWLTTCEMDVQDCTSDCFPDGPIADANCKDYAPTFCIEVPFQINEGNLRSSIYSKEELVARSLLKAIKKIEENIAAKAVAFLENSEGVNVFPGDYGTVVGATVGNSYTKINPTLWTSALMGYFMQASKHNLLTSPYAISGDNLYLAYWNAQAEFANADGKGGLNKFNALKPYFDLFNIDTAFANPSTFLLDKSAVAFGAKWEYGETPTDFGSNIGERYSIPSKTLPGVRYDVHHLMTCGTDKKIVHKFNVIARGGFYLNPVGCTETNTHVLRFTKQA